MTQEKTHSTPASPEPADYSGEKSADRTVRICDADGQKCIVCYAPVSKGVIAHRRGCPQWGGKR